MTATDLCREQCAAVALQLERVYAGMPGAVLEARLYPDFVSPRELPAHLAECGTALLNVLRGEKHSWGTYQPAAGDFEGQMAEYKALRDEALEAAFALGTDEALRHVTSYIVLHDAYHVGQLCALRARVEGWDTESIYG